MYANHIWKKVLKGYSKGVSARELSKKFDVPQVTIHRWIRDQKNGRLRGQKRVRRGRFSSSQKQLIVRLQQQNPESGLAGIAQLYAETTSEKKPAPQTVRKVLHEAGYSYRRTVVKKENENPEQEVDYRYQEKHRKPAEATQTRPQYPSDLSDAQWALLAPYFSKKETRGRKRNISLREYINAIFYVLRTGCPWRYLPHDFPPWNNVSRTFYRLRDKGIWEKINDALSKKARVQLGRNENPTACIIDSQSVKTTEKGGSRALMARKK